MELNSLSSVSKSNFFPKFQEIIELTDFIFEKGNKNDAVSVVNKLKDILLDPFKNNSFQFYDSINILTYFQTVRYKNTEFFATVYRQLITELPLYKEYITQLIENSTQDTIHSQIQQIITSPTVISYKEFKLTNNLPEPFKYILYDDLDSLKTYISQNNNFDPDTQLYRYHYEWSKIIDPFNKDFLEIYLLDFCAVFGNDEIFKYLKVNGCCLSQSIAERAVFGGNFNIIHILEQNEISFDSCLSQSIKFHHNEVSEWLLNNYKCEDLSLYKCILYCDYRAFLFFFHKKGIPTSIQSDFGLENPEYSHKVIGEAIELVYNANSNFSKISQNLTFSRTISNPHYIKFFYENNLLSSITYSLLMECSRDYPNIEAIKYILSLDCKMNQKHTQSLLALLNSSKNILCIKYLIFNCNNLDLNYVFQQYCYKTNPNIEIVKILIEAGADINNNGELSPLFQLCLNSVDYSIIQYMLENGADPNKNNPLLALCMAENPDLNKIKLLVDHGADVNKGNLLFPLFTNFKNFHFECVEYLIKKGADVNQSPIPILHLIISNIKKLDKSVFYVIEFLIKNGIDLNKGNPLLVYFKKEYYIDMDLVKLFITNGADPNQGEILPYLCQNFDYFWNKGKAIEYLIKNGGDPNKGDLLHKLCSVKEPDKSLIQLLIDNGADVNQGEFTPLWYLCFHSQDLSIIKILIENGADVNKGNPLFLLCNGYGVEFNSYWRCICTTSIFICFKVEAIQLLLEKGADVNQGSPTPLYAACHIFSTPVSYETKYKTIKLLLKYGADVNKGIDNSTPLDALQFGNNELDQKIAEFLIENGAVKGTELINS